MICCDMLTSSTSQECFEMDLDALCRLCGSDQGIRVSIFEQGTDHVKKIHKVLPITVNEHDPFPKSMCHRCSFRVNEFFEFRLKCIKAQELFRSRVPWLRDKQRTSLKHCNPPMVELPLNAVDSVSPNEKLELNGINYVDDSEPTIIVSDDESSGSEEDTKLHTSLLNGPQNKILMRFEKKKPKPGKKSIWEPKKKKRRSRPTCEIAEVFTASVDTFEEMGDIENDPLQLSPASVHENNINQPASPRSENIGVEKSSLPDEVNGDVKLPKHIIITNIPCEGRLYTCENCGRTFLSPKPANSHSCGNVNGTDDNRTKEVNNVESSNNIDIYKCNTCGESFTRQSQLASHRKKHSKVDESSEDEKTRTYKRRKKIHAKKKDKPSILAPKTFSYPPIREQITRHSLLSSDSE